MSRKFRTNRTFKGSLIFLFCLGTITSAVASMSAQTSNADKVAVSKSVQNDAKTFLQLKPGLYKLTAEDKYCESGSLSFRKGSDGYDLLLGSRVLALAIDVPKLKYTERDCNFEHVNQLESDKLRVRSTTACKGKPKQIREITVQKTAKGFDYTVHVLDDKGKATTSHTCRLIAVR